MRLKRAFDWVVIATLALAMAAVCIAQELTPVQEQELDDGLAELRAAMEAYKKDHYDYPGVVTTDGYGLQTDNPEAVVSFLDQLMKFTSMQGAVSEVYTGSCNLGPYIVDIPVNPANGLKTVTAEMNIYEKDALPDRATLTTRRSGWKIVPRKGVVFADDGDNVER